MVFNSPFFIATLAVIYTAYIALQGRWQAAKLVLIAYNFFFYGIWSLKFLAIMLATASVDYVSGRLMGAFPHHRKIFLAASVVLGLTPLAAFKYLNFAIESSNSIGAWFGLTLDWPTLNIILPIGISFYTFHSLSYAIDVYRQRIQPIRSYSDYLLFVSFFPCLVAGPIIRAPEFMPQIVTAPRPTGADFLTGLWMVAFGLFLKSVVADNVGPRVNTLFDNYAANGIFENWLAGGLFGVQIFADFAGYSGIAIGLARMMGIRLPRNFNAPYASIGFSDFWRRWHISLSTWFRDYFYIPIGGNRVGIARQALNLTLTMFLCGLWHGASVLFIIWGLMHGLFLAAEHMLKQAFGREPKRALSAAATYEPHWINIVVLQGLTFAAVCAAWLAFRAKTFDQFAAMFRGLFTGPLRSGTAPIWLAFIVAGIVLLHLIQRRFDLTGRVEQSPRLSAAAIAVCLYCVLTFGTKGQDFIYFQF